MNKDNFAKARAKLKKTQKELGNLLGVSLKAVQSGFANIGILQRLDRTPAPLI